MPTDTERREAARRLREEADYPGHAVQYMEQFISDLRQVLFGDLNPTADYSEMFTRLADLIDPDCEEGRYEGVHTARPVDRDALLALAEEMGHPIKQAIWNQTAGVRREHIMAEYARRIREALGVES